MFDPRVQTRFLHFLPPFYLIFVLQGKNKNKKNKKHCRPNINMRSHCIEPTQQFHLVIFEKNLGSEWRAMARRGEAVINFGTSLIGSLRKSAPIYHSSNPSFLLWIYTTMNIPRRSGYQHPIQSPRQPPEEPVYESCTMGSKGIFKWVLKKSLKELVKCPM